MGGLGNQLFQICTVIAYALRHKCAFKFEYKEVLVAATSRETYWNSLMKSLKTMTVRHALSFPVYREPFFKYKEIPVIKHDMKLYGYFQSYKYFEDKMEIILKLLKWNETQEMVRAKYGAYLDVPCVSVHFRLGDYKKLQHIHPIQPYEYYLAALRRIGNKRVLYFCEKEDNEIVMKTIERLKEDVPNEFVKVEDDIADWEQMVLMSLCNDNIIANSTFSWWGAYLNRHKGKHIIYPYEWFGAAVSHDTADLFPEGWERL
jgi:hypothetical protein